MHDRARPRCWNTGGFIVFAHFDRFTQYHHSPTCPIVIIRTQNEYLRTRKKKNRWWAQPCLPANDVFVSCSACVWSCTQTHTHHFCMAHRMWGRRRCAQRGRDVVVRIQWPRALMTCIWNATIQINRKISIGRAHTHTPNRTAPNLTNVLACRTATVSRLCILD